MATAPTAEALSSTPSESRTVAVFALTVPITALPVAWLATGVHRFLLPQRGWLDLGALMFGGTVWLACVLVGWIAGVFALQRRGVRSRTIARIAVVLNSLILLFGIAVIVEGVLHEASF